MRSLPAAPSRLRRASSFDQRRDRLCQRADVFGRHEYPGFAVGNGFDEAARSETDHGQAGSRGFQRGNAEPFGQRRVREHVEAAEIVIDVVLNPANWTMSPISSAATCS